MVDIIIPTYKPDINFANLIDRLTKQTMMPDHIILMNTEQSLWEEFLSGDGENLDVSRVEVHHIRKSEFDHGHTRNEGVGYSKSDIFIMMTQDAIPADDFFIEKIIAPLADESVAATFARQMAKEDSTLVEKLTREFNYPDTSSVKSSDDVERLGIKAYFCSNVSCAYRRSVYDELGGFIDRAIFNEDMVYAASAISAGYKIAYAADARVYHSHNYSAKEQFHRNVDVGISQADHPEVFEGISSESEGSRMVKTTISRLISEGQALRVIPYIYMTGCKYIGYLIGKNYKKLPAGFVRRCSMNPGYFDK